MYRYISLNPNSNQNSLNVNRKATKANPISLLSGRNSFFVKVKSNQIASNYNDKNRKIKNNAYQKNNNTFFAKENKDKSLIKYLNNSQPKVTFLFKVNNSIEKGKNKNNNISLINRTNHDILTHNKGIYSFTSTNYNTKLNNNSINSISFRKNYNEVFLTDYDHSNSNQNKILNNQRKSKEKRKINKDKKDKNVFSYNTYDYLINHTKTLNLKSKLNKKQAVESTNNKAKNTFDKKVIQTNKNGINNQIKIRNKNSINNNNNKNIIRYKNISNILFNTNLNIDKNKLKNDDKCNIQEGKNRVILDRQKRNYKIINNNHSLLNENINNINIFNENIKEIEEFDSNLSNRKIERKIKSIKINSNNEGIKIKNNNIKNNNIKYNFNTTNIEKSLKFQKNNYEKILGDNKDIVRKNNNIIHKNSKLDNLLPENKINLNHVLKNLTNLNSKTNGKQEKINLIKNDINSIKNVIEINSQKNQNYRNNLSDLISNNIEKNKETNNKTNKIINKNFLYDYFPMTTALNNSVDNNNNINRLALNRISSIENNYHTNIDKNIQGDKFLNYSTTEEKQIKKENNNKLNKKYKKEEHIKLDINNEKEQDSNNLINKAYNFHTKFISSNTLDFNINKIKSNQNNLNFYRINSNNNNISDNYVSKEKNKKRKQNPPLNKIPKKLNILSIIQENNRKIKNNMIRRKPIISSTFNDNKIYNKLYKNDCVTIENILYPDNVEFNNDTEMFDNFDDMNSIIRRINFENVSLKKSNIFTVENKYNDKNFGNIWYEKYSENFNNLFDKKFGNNKQDMSATQNKIKKNNYIYNSKQSGSTKASNVENSSTKKIKVSSYYGKKIEDNSLIKINKNI